MNWVIGICLAVIAFILGFLAGTMWFGICTIEREHKEKL